jgi:type VI secretion system protein ImpL
VAGARITAITSDGQAIELVNEPGRMGWKRITGMATFRKLDADVNEMTWSSGPYKVTVHLRVLRAPGEAPPTNRPAGSGNSTGGTAAMSGMGRLQNLKLPALVVGIDGAAAKPEAAAALAAASGAAR